MTLHCSLISLIHAYLILTIHFRTAAALAFCTGLYGTPDYFSCDELLNGHVMSGGYTGIGNTDRRDHLFALPFTQKPPDTSDEQWANKVNLPIIRSNRKSIRSSKIANPLLKSPPQVQCKLALIPLLSQTGAISTDTSHYPSIASTGDQIQTSCVYPLNESPSGGHSRAGDNSRLLLVLYARDSDFDNKVRRRIAQGQPILGIETADGGIVPSTIGFSDGSDNDDDAASSTIGPPQLGYADPNDARDRPSCGQYCSGPSGLCDEASGCLCIADPWQGVGSASFTGKCKVPYRYTSTNDLPSSSSSSYSSSGRELLASDLNSTTNATVPYPGNNSTITLTIQGGLADDSPCPCNCTYVSRGCCNSTTGILHEAPGLKLGMLKAPNSSFVCDAGTGRFRSNVD